VPDAGHRQVEESRPHEDVTGPARKFGITGDLMNRILWQDLQHWPVTICG
jgi:hypothetical protein